MVNEMIKIKNLTKKLILSGIFSIVAIFGLTLSINDFQFNNFVKAQFPENSIFDFSIEQSELDNSTLENTDELNIYNRLEPIPMSKETFHNLSEINTNSINCNCIAFRLDDVQDHWLTNSQIEIMEIFNEREIPLTIGIIGNRIGEDEIIVSYIKQRIPSKLFEIANHGWNHEHFKEYNLTTQNLLLKNTNEKIQKIFGITPSVFIPPYNEFNDDTIFVMSKNNITYFSSSISQSEPPYIVNSHLQNFPEAAATGKQPYEGSLIDGVNHEITLYEIHKSISERGFAVVMLHPQEFSIIENEKYSENVNWRQIMELELLFDRIQSKGIKTVLISNINSKT
jgi:peptidoglycan/xylan/chitin deacetylase (PgdA/CDA1 family)